MPCSPSHLSEENDSCRRRSEPQGGCIAGSMGPTLPIGAGITGFLAWPLPFLSLLALTRYIAIPDSAEQRLCTATDPLVRYLPLVHDSLVKADLDVAHAVLS